MITQASDYKLTDVDEAIIRGKIVPVTDGTAEQNVARQEDLCYLVEMARERCRWGFTEAAGLYVKGDRCRSTGLINEIYSAIEFQLRFGIETVPANWTYPMPFVRIGDESGVISRLSEMMSESDSFASIGRRAGRLERCEDLRYAYCDLSKCRRFRCLLGPASGSWSEARDRWREGGSPFVGPICANDGVSSFYNDEGVYYSQQGYSNQSYTTQWAAGVQQGMYGTANNPVLLVRKGFFDLGSGKTLLDAGPMVVYSVGSVGQTYIVNRRTQVISAHTFGAAYLRDAGSTEGTVFEDVADRFLSFEPNVRSYHEVLDRLMSGRIEGWVENKSSLTAAVSDIYVDTGNLTLRTDLPEGWNWRPEGA